MSCICCQHRRLPVIKLAATLNGIEDLEVAAAGPPQRTLLVRLLRPAAGISADHVSITGGDRIRDIEVQWVSPADTLPAGEDPALVAGLEHPDHVLVVRTNQAGDYSTYTLHIKSANFAEGATPFDPVLSRTEFSFKVDCHAKFDCRDHCTCPPETRAVPQIDYLARDYASLRRMLLDRMGLLAPDWTERSPADVGVMLVEVLAHEGDRLSYRQDAVATEAYLDTARSRVSLRRHARLVDYHIHDGCSARVLLHCTAAAAAATLPAGTAVYSATPGQPEVLSAAQQKTALSAAATVFETVADTVLHADHNTFFFYTWGDEECCLPKGSTAATLHGTHPALRAGDILIFAEQCSPTNAEPADRDPAHIWPVRLTHVRDAVDPSGGHFKKKDPKNKANDPVPVTEIEWDAADRLPFSLCLSAPNAEPDPVSVAWGNIVIADHGRTIEDDELGVVPAAHLRYPLTGGHCSPQEQTRPPAPRYRPRLRHGPLTRTVDVAAPVVADTAPIQAVLDELTAAKPNAALRGWLSAHGLQFISAATVIRGAGNDWTLSDGATVAQIRVDTAGRMVLLGRPPPASAISAANPRAARPDITLSDGTKPWLWRRDLIGRGDAERVFVVETEHDGTAFLRLQQPDAGVAFKARYRVGNGVAGNVGAGTLVHIANNPAAAAVRNPLPAAGGREPETAEEIRRDAPQAYQVQQRAVTPADWEDVAARNPRVQHAAATWRWTGSWHTVFLTVDPAGAVEVDDPFEHDLRRDLEKYRMAGYDLEVERPRYVPLEIGVHVCLQHAHLRPSIRGEILAAVGHLFDPDLLTFGQPVYLSRIYAAAHAVPGVTAVTVDPFRRQHDTAVSGIDSGVLTMGRLEIARLDNNPNYPERGVLTLTLGGAR